MNKLIILFLAILPTASQAINEDPMKIRKCFHESVIDESMTEEFHEKVMKIKNPDATQYAYQAASFALLAKKTWNPIAKLSLISRYGKMIDQAIEKAPESIEIRFLRLSIDYYTPAILGRKDNISKDKSQILALLAPIGKFKLDSSFNRFILYFLEHEAICNTEELAFVASRLN